MNNIVAEIKERVSLLDLVREAGVVLRKVGKEWKGLCPFHNENSPSFFVTDEVYHCFGCGAEGDVIRFVEQRFGYEFKRACEYLANRAGIHENGNGNGQFRQTFDYGPVQKCRIDTEDKGKKFIVRRPDGNGGWIYNADGIDCDLLYHADRLAGASDVFIVEGEKDVRTLERMKLTATTSFTRKWSPKFASHFSKDQNIVILPDNDDTGLKYAADVAKGLSGHVASIRILMLPGLAQKGDVSDWAVGKDPDLAGEELAKLADSAPEYKQPVSLLLTDVVVSANAFLELHLPEREPVIDSVFTLGSLNSVWSWRGLGKTQLLMSAAAAIATGTTWLHWSVPQPRHVLYIDGELPGSYLQWVVRNWLAGQDGSNVSILASDVFYEKHHRQMDLMLADDQNMLLTFLEAEEKAGRRPDVIILDNLSCLFWDLRDGMHEQDTLIKFLLALRHRNYCVIPTDHGGKSREVRGARGASRKEDPADVVIKLDEPTVPSQYGSSKFSFEFTKFRGRLPKPYRFECEMAPVADNYDFWQWQTGSASEANIQVKILQYLATHTVEFQAELADVFGMTAGAMSKHLTKLRKSGYLEGLTVTAAGHAFLSQF